jgi:hypothetical protein
LPNDEKLLTDSACLRVKASTRLGPNTENCDIGCETSAALPAGPSSGSPPKPKRLQCRGDVAPSSSSRKAACQSRIADFGRQFFNAHLAVNLHQNHAQVALHNASTLPDRFIPDWGFCVDEIGVHSWILLLLKRTIA